MNGSLEIKSPDIKKLSAQLDSGVKRLVAKALADFALIHKAETSARIPEDTGITARSVVSNVDIRNSRVVTAVLHNHGASRLNIPLRLNVLGAGKSAKAKQRASNKSGRTGKRVGARYALRAVLQEKEQYIDVLRRHFTIIGRG